MALVAAALLTLTLEWSWLSREQRAVSTVVETLPTAPAAYLPLTDAPEVYEWDQTKSIVREWRQQFDALLADALTVAEPSRLKKKDRVDVDASAVDALLASVPMLDAPPPPRPAGLRVALVNARASTTLLEADYLPSLRPDIVVLTELYQVANDSLRLAAASWEHDVAWIGPSRDQLDIGVTCRRCTIVQTRRIGLGYWGRDVVYPVTFEHSAHALVLRLDDASALNLVVAHLDGSSPSRRQQEATEIERFVSAHRLFLAPLLVAATDAGLAHADALGDVVARAVELGVRTVISSGMGTAYEATDALAAHLDDLCGPAPTIPTRVVAPTAYRASAAALAVELGAPLRVDYLFASAALAERRRSCVAHRTTATATLSDHAPLVADFERWTT